MEYTCALDAAEEGPMTLERCGELMGMRIEPVRRVQARATIKIKEVLDE